MIALTIFVLAFSILRDNDYANKKCCNEIDIEIWYNESDKCDKETQPFQSLIYAHGTMILIVLLTGCIIRGIFVMVIINAISIWNFNYKYNDPEVKDSVEDRVKSKLFHLYNNYIKIGTKTKAYHDAFKEWFVLQYLTYLLRITTVVIHIIKSNDQGINNEWDLPQSTMLIVYDALAFLVPFIAATWLNNAHDEHYKDMVKEYYTYKGYIPGYMKSKGVNTEDENKTLIHSWCKAITEKVEDKKAYKDDYLKYYDMAIKRDDMAKKSDFDFTPSFLNLDIPLQSPGYTLTILLALLAFVFNFTSLP